MLQTSVITREHPEIRKHMMAEQNRLCMLQVRIPGHDNAEAIFCLFEQHLAKRDILLNQALQECFRMEAQVNGNLVIARASRMQPRARSPDYPSQLGLDRHMDVFVVDIENERTVVYALPYGLKALMDSIRIVNGNDPLGGKHSGMGLRTCDVLRIHFLIYTKRRPEFLREFIHAPLKPSRPQRHDAHLSVKSEALCDSDENPPCILREKASKDASIFC